MKASVMEQMATGKRMQQTRFAILRYIGEQKRTRNACVHICMYESAEDKMSSS